MYRFTYTRAAISKLLLLSVLYTVVALLWTLLAVVTQFLDTTVFSWFGWPAGAMTVVSIMYWIGWFQTRRDPVALVVDAEGISLHPSTGRRFVMPWARSQDLAWGSYLGQGTLKLGGGPGRMIGLNALEQDPHLLVQAIMHFRGAPPAGQPPPVLGQRPGGGPHG